MIAVGTHLFRATIFHTPANPFDFDIGDPRALTCHQDGGLLAGDGRVVACGEYESLRAEHPAVPTTDWRGGFIVPGFIDSHVHFPQLRIIGALGHTLLDWLEHVALPEEARMSETPYAADTARRFVRALASHGTTTALVFGAHFPAATAELFEAAAASGLRVVSGLVLSDRRLRPELHQTPDQAYRESRQLIERYHKRGRLLYAVTPRFALSTTDAMLDVCRRLLAEYQDVRLQTHINENSDEIAELARLFPWATDYLAVYDRYGLTTSRSVMAHNIHATSAELERMAAAGTAVAHCPGSNAALGSGVFPLSRHVEAGVVCSIGTDVGGGIGFGMMKEGLQAYLMQRLAPDPQILDAARLLYLTTLAGAKALDLDSEIGDFRAGKAADFVYLRPPADSVLASAVHQADSPQRALSALFTMAGPESVREVRVAGDVVHRMGEL
ncbi:MAG: guanine deaminase [Vicinamibacterales bacterium]|nr:guanine deaminase [Vicinamibacterales bacterium]